MNASIAWNIMSGANFVSMLKSKDFEKLYLPSLTAKAYDPASGQKMVQYVYNNGLVSCLWTSSRGDVLQPYVHDRYRLYDQNDPVELGSRKYLVKQQVII